MAGILESLFDNGGWQQVLGIGSASAAPAAPPSPPPRQIMTEAPPSFSPTSAMGSGGPLSFNDRAQPAQTAINEGVFDPRGGNYTDFKPMPARMTQRMPAADSPPRPYTTQAENGPAPAASPGVMPVSDGGGVPQPPMAQPMPRPPVTMPRPPSAMPNSAEEIIPGGQPMPLSLGGGPPMPPPGAMNGGPPTMSGGGGLMAALGLGTPQGRQSVLAGLGKGMSAVGAMRSGAPKGAAFATGLGGGIQGQQEKEEKDLAVQRQAVKDAFSQDLQTKNYDVNKLNAAIRLRQQEMQIPWWQARADVLRLKQGQDASSKAWQMSEPGRYHTVNLEARAHHTALIQENREELKNATPEEAKKIRAGIADEVEKFRKARMLEQGLDPNKADTVMKRGYEPKGTPEEQEKIIKHLPAGTMVYNPKTGTSSPRKLDQWNTPIGADTAAAAAAPTTTDRATDTED